jgi:sugar-phosphatase
MRAVIFDMDGLIVDSEPLWRLAERATFAEVGLDLSDADCERTMGMRSDEVIRFWFDEHPWTGRSLAEVEERLENRVRELIAERATAMPGVEHAMAMARAEGLLLGLASSSSPALIDAVLEKLKLMDHFAAVCSAVDEVHGKPDPAVFLSAASMLDVAPTECVAIEDSLAGVRSARDAGMRVIAVPPPHLIDDPGYDIANIKLGSLEDLSSEMIR